MFFMDPLILGLILLLISIGLIVFIRWIIKKLRARGGIALRLDPMDVAKGRYARGEISREEFEQIRKDLSSS